MTSKSISMEAIKFYVKMKSGPVRNETDYKESEEKLVQKVKEYLIDSTEKIAFSIRLINYWQLHD